MLKFGSVCSGIEAASVAWGHLGWEAAWLAEIEAFPSAVLAHHYPDVPNLGDMTTLPSIIKMGLLEAPDVFCGGTPCQAFSVAGLRRSLDDARGNLSLTFCEIANAIDEQRLSSDLAPAVIFWENVPGVLNTKDNAFGCFLGALAGEDEPIVPSGKKWTNAGCVYGPQRTVAWRVLDAQYFGVAQRRRRVFVVASARDGFDPTAVLFESEGVRRDTAPSRETRKEVTELAGTLTANGGGLDRPAGNANELDFCVAQCLTTGTGQRYDPETETETIIPSYGIRTANTSSNGWGIQEEVTHTLDCAQGVAVAQPIAFPARMSATQCASSENIAPAMGATNPTAVATSMQVRRLTPTECERLQGFPDGYTNIPWRGKSESPDGPRYKALGNSWAVPVVRWIGKRIQKELNADT